MSSSVGAAVCSMLEPSRVDLVLALEGSARTSAELSKLLAVSRKAIGRQLGILKATSLVYSDQVNHTPLYRLTKRGEQVLAGIKLVASA